MQHFQKRFVLFVLFVIPLVAYLFFASGINNFGRLPVVSPTPFEAQGIELDQKITILGFLGDRVSLKKAFSSNLNEKIYKRFHEFKDFQVVLYFDPAQEQAVTELKAQLGELVDLSHWFFIPATEVQVTSMFSALSPRDQLNEDGGSNYVFIIDKDRMVRGRTPDDSDYPYARYDATSVADLSKYMVDDVKILLAEYRMALKKNNGR
jgi:hypothetical protein